MSSTASMTPNDCPEGLQIGERDRKQQRDYLAKLEGRLLADRWLRQRREEQSARGKRNEEGSTIETSGIDSR